MPYPEELCKPMREELTSNGFEEMKTTARIHTIAQRACFPRPPRCYVAFMGGDGRDNTGTCV